MACQSDNQQQEATEPTGAAETPAKTSSTAPSKTPAESALPPLPMDRAKSLWETCDYIDYVFYELPFSMSLDQKSDIQGTVRHISASPVPVLKPECKSIGRIFFQANGENILSAEFYFAVKEGCFYYVFIEDNKPTYANLLTEDAVAYYNKTFSMVRSQTNGQ